mmetsp:Transcript_100331/g.279372  ORF Transcript_100331/g.279372 Transcript_100331/m.279372 type:complete len:351 (-) Transcript_100331:440-1492(-)
MLHQQRGQQRPGGKGLVGLVVGQLENIGAAVGDDPDLRRHGLVSQPRHAQAQPATARAQPDQARHEVRIRFCHLPALGIHRLVGGDASLQPLAVPHQLEPAALGRELLGVALDRVAHLAAAVLQVVGPVLANRLVPVAEREVAVHAQPCHAQRALEQCELARGRVHRRETVGRCACTGPAHGPHQRQQVFGPQPLGECRRVKGSVEIGQGADLSTHSAGLGHGRQHGQHAAVLTQHLQPHLVGIGLACINSIDQVSEPVRAELDVLLLGAAHQRQRVGGQLAHMGEGVDAGAVVMDHGRVSAQRWFGRPRPGGRRPGACASSRPTGNLRPRREPGRLGRREPRRPAPGRH